MKININRILNHIEIISKYNTTPGEGCTRLSFTDEDRGVRDYLINNMKELGMRVSVDSIGNIKGRLNGTNPELPVVMCGSHIDTVINGGNYDGVLGVVCALEVAQTIVGNGIEFKNPYEIIIFAEEEGITFNYNLVGSKTITGLCRLEDIKELEDNNGISRSSRGRENI